MYPKSAVSERCVCKCQKIGGGVAGCKVVAQSAMHARQSALKGTTPLPLPAPLPPERRPPARPAHKRLTRRCRAPLAPRHVGAGELGRVGRQPEKGLGRVPPDLLLRRERRLEAALRVPADAALAQAVGTPPVVRRVLARLEGGGVRGGDGEARVRRARIPEGGVWVGKRRGWGKKLTCCGCALASRSTAVRSSHSRREMRQLLSKSRNVNQNCVAKGKGKQGEWFALSAVQGRLWRSTAAFQLPPAAAPRCRSQSVKQNPNNV
jgi:hypothetical protein